MGIDQDKRNKLLTELEADTDFEVLSDDLIIAAKERILRRKEEHIRKKELLDLEEKQRKENLLLRASLPENQDETLVDFLNRVGREFNDPKKFNDQCIQYIIKNWEILMNNFSESVNPGKSKMSDLIYKLMDQYLMEEVILKMNLSFEESVVFLSKYWGQIVDNIAYNYHSHSFGSKETLIKFTGMKRLTYEDASTTIEIKPETRMKDIIEKMLDFCGIEKNQNYDLAEIYKRLKKLIDVNLAVPEGVKARIFVVQIQEIPKHFVHGYVSARQIDLEKFHENSEKVVLSRQGTENFLEWCLYIFSGMKRKIINFKAVLDRENKAAEERALAMVKEEERSAEIVFPEMVKFPKLAEKLRVYMVREGIRRKYHRVVYVGYEYDGKDNRDNDGEKEYFLAMARSLNQKEINTIMKRLSEYEKRYGFLKNGEIFNPTKRSYRKKIGQIEIPEEIDAFYNLAKYFYKLFRIGSVYVSTGRAEMAERGELLMEVARMGSEYLHDIAVNIEAKLMDPDFLDTELRGLFASLGSLLGRAELTRYLNGASLVHSDLLAIRSAQDEMAGGDEGADFMKRLKALPPKEK